MTAEGEDVDMKPFGLTTESLNELNGCHGENNQPQQSSHSPLDVQEQQKLINESNILLQRNRRLEAACRDYERQLYELLQKKDDSDELRRKLSEKSQSCAQVAVENMALKKEIEQFKALMIENNTVGREVTTLKTKLKRKDTALKKNREISAEAKSSFLNLSKENDMLQSQLQKVTSERDEFINKCRTLEMENNKLKMELKCRSLQDANQLLQSEVLQQKELIKIKDMELERTKIIHSPKTRNLPRQSGELFQTSSQHQLPLLPPVTPNSAQELISPAVGNHASESGFPVQKEEAEAFAEITALKKPCSLPLTPIRERVQHSSFNSCEIKLEPVEERTFSNESKVQTNGVEFNHLKHSITNDEAAECDNKKSFKSPPCRENNCIKFVPQSVPATKYIKVEKLAEDADVCASEAKKVCSHIPAAAFSENIDLAHKSCSITRLNGLHLKTSHFSQSSPLVQTEASQNNSSSLIDNSKCNSNSSSLHDEQNTHQLAKKVSFECSIASSSPFQGNSSSKTSEAVSFSKKVNVDETCMAKEFRISTLERSNINDNPAKSFPPTFQSESAFADEMLQHNDDDEVIIIEDCCDAKVQSNTTEAQLQNCVTVAQTRPRLNERINDYNFESSDGSCDSNELSNGAEDLPGNPVTRSQSQALHGKCSAGPSSSLSCTTQNPITNCNQLKISSVTHTGKASQCGIATSSASSGCFEKQKQSFVKNFLFNKNKVAKKILSKKSKWKKPQLKVKKGKNISIPNKICLPVKKHLYTVLQLLESLYTNAGLYGNLCHDLQHSLSSRTTVRSAEVASEIIISYLVSSSKLNPLLSYLNSSATTDLMPLPERCIAEASVSVTKKYYPHLCGLLETLMGKLHAYAVQSHMFDVFTASAVCRVYIMFCQLNDSFQEARALVRALLQSRQDSSHYIIASVAGVWPDVLKNTHDVEFIDAAIKYVLLQKPEGLDEEMWRQCHAVFQMCDITSVSECHMAQKALGFVKFFSSNKNEEAKKECEQILRLFISKIGFSWVQDTFISAISNCVAQYDTTEEQEDLLYNLIEFIGFLNEFSVNNSFETAIGKQLSHVMNETTASS